jgi:carbon monoxide dehydrogenase subunit G
MALRFEGERNLPLPIEQVWPKLRDAVFLVHCIPDATIQGQPERDRAQCAVRPNLAFVRGQLEVTVQILEAREPTALRFALLSKGVGSSSEVECCLALVEQGGSTAAGWVAEVKQLGGLLKMVPSGLIRGAAQKVIDDVWSRIAARLAE